MTTGHHPPPRPDGKLPTTLTFLEMLAPPARPIVAAQPAANVELRLVQPPDLALNRYLYDAVGRTWLWYERKLRQDEDVLAYLADPKVEMYALYEGDVVAGYAELDSRQWPDVELAYFGLLPVSIGKGYGPWMLDRLADMVWARGPKRYWVYTNLLDHPKALDRYVRSGFTIYKRMDTMYDDPRALWPDEYPPDAQPRIA
jgi:GNAT superfamily N-acetyltransferase